MVIINNTEDIKIYHSLLKQSEDITISKERREDIKTQAEELKKLIDQKLINQKEKIKDISKEDIKMEQTEVVKKEKVVKVRIKDKVAELEDECYNYLLEKTNNDVKVLISLILRLLTKTRDTKKEK
jgi:hypothetical protein